MKLLKYRRLILACFCLGAIGLFASCHQFSITLEPAVSKVADNSEYLAAISDQNNAIADVTESSIPKPTNLLNYHPSLKNNGKQGKLRASNQTNQPVRLALLSRHRSPTKSANNKSNLPAHWDFAPQEGSEKGMILSLPQGKLSLEKGDVVVGFAQDGSRRYWGPYVVGESQYPIWNPDTKEWQLILAP